MIPFKTGFIQGNRPPLFYTSSFFSKDYRFFQAFSHFLREQLSAMVSTPGLKVFLLISLTVIKFLSS